MSANNWGKCPKCQLRFKQEDEKSLYGTVSENEYEVIKKKRKQERSVDTLREDYEIRIDAKTNTFEIWYGGECDVCGFSFEFNHKEELDLT